MSAALRAEKGKRAEDRKALELEGQRLLGAGAAGAGGAESAAYSNDLRGKLQALLVLAVSCWALWEGRIVQGLLWSPRTDR